MNNLPKNFIVIAIVLAGALIGGAVLYVNQTEVKSLTSEEAGQKAIDFINQTIEEDVTASLLEVIDSGLVYKIRLEIVGTQYESFITKDGKLLFPTGFNLEGQKLEEVSQEETP